MIHIIFFNSYIFLIYFYIFIFCFSKFLFNLILFTFSFICFHSMEHVLVSVDDPCNAGGAYQTEMCSIVMILSNG